MISRRNTLKSVVGGSLALPFAGVTLAAAEPALSWTAFPADENGFLRAPVLVTGRTEAVLIDAGFNYAEGRRVIEAIRASGKTLKTVYVSANDPDYYFNLPIIRRAYPDVPILAVPPTVELMRKKAEGKVATWAAKLGSNDPARVADLVFPEPSTIDRLTVDGQEIQILNVPGTNDRSRYLWVPSLRAVFGGVAVFSGMYPWIADVSSVAERNAWIAALDAIAAHRPEIVVPGHMRPDWPMDMSGVTYTRDYVAAFNEEDARTANSAELIEAMRQRFPGGAMPISLELGAKVAKGEMRWG